MRPDDLQALTSPDTEDRRRAIIALGRAKDPAALNALADVYRNDPDPALRELAQKAGRYIQSSAAGTTPADSPYAKPIETYDATSPQYHVSAATAERARGYLDRAIDFQVRGDDVKAVENLGRAFEINPALRHDTIGLNLAMDLTGLGSNAAVATLADPASRYELMQRMMGVEIAAGRRTAVAEATWGGAFIDLGIYGLVNGAIVFVVSLVAAELLFRVLMVGVRNAPSSSANLALLADLNTQQITLPLAGLYGLLAGVGAVVMLLVIDSAIHIVATTVLGGQGTLAGLVRKTTLYYTVLTGVSLLLNIGFAALAVNVDRNTASALSYLPLLVSLALALWAGKLTGDAYDFGTAKGCVSMMLGYFVLMATLFCCSVALGMALASSVQALP